MSWSPVWQRQHRGFRFPARRVLPFQVVDAGASLRNTVFHQVFQKIRGKMEIIIEKHDAFDFRRRQKMTEIRLRNVKNVLQFFTAAGSEFFFC